MGVFFCFFFLNKQKLPWYGNRGPEGKINGNYLTVEDLVWMAGRGVLLISMPDRAKNKQTIYEAPARQKSINASTHSRKVCEHPTWCNPIPSRPWWLSWMRRPTGDQEVAGSTPAEVGNILSWRLIMKYFLRSFSPFRRVKQDSCQFLAKECAQYWLTA